MEKFCPHALESILRGNDWEAKFRGFYYSVCPRFKNFSSSSLSPSSVIGDGSGFDIQMFDAYRDFIAFFDSNILVYMNDMGVSLSTFEKSLALNLKEGDSSALNLYHQLEMYGDFLKFSLIMRTKYEVTFLLGSTSAISPDTTITTPTKADNLMQKGRSVRVLWDIENVSIQKKIGGLRTLQHLNRFLQTQGLQGSGIDCRISAFFSPIGGRIPKNTIEELDKGAVELIWVSAKREDADRKLGVRINQEMKVLDPRHTTFVIISSDQDFRHFYQLLKGEGYGVIVIHEAIEGNWVEVLEMHADFAYRWRDIMSDTDGTYTATTTTAVTDGDEGKGVDVHHDSNGNGNCDTAVNQSSGSSSGGGQQRSQIQRQRQQGQTQGINGHESACKATYAEISKGASVTAHPHPVSDKNSPHGQIGDVSTSSSASTGIVEYPVGFCLGWLEGTCIRWKGTYGFLSVQTLPVCPPTSCTDMSVQQPLRVYVHYKSLNFNVPTMQLSRGQRVRALLKIGDRGPYAVKVEPVYSELILDS